MNSESLNVDHVCYCKECMLRFIVFRFGTQRLAMYKCQPILTLDTTATVEPERETTTSEYLWKYARAMQVSQRMRTLRCKTG